MKKQTKDLQSKTIKELEKMSISLREEIAKLLLNRKVNPGKDVNNLFKKRKQLAVLLTVLSQKKDIEMLQNIKKI